MRSIRAGCFLALILLAPPLLPAQARYSASFGVVAGTSLARDQIFREIDVQQDLAPTLTLGVAWPVSKREFLGLETAVGFGGVTTVEPGYPDTEGPSFTTVSLLGSVDGPIIGPARYRIAAGMLKYLPDEQGIFAEGGPLLLVLGAGADVRLLSRQHFTLMARLRYDYQRFNTDELQFRGFSRTQDVHRLGLGLGVDYRRP